MLTGSGEGGRCEGDGAEGEGWDARVSRQQVYFQLMSEIAIPKTISLDRVRGVCGKNEIKLGWDKDGEKGGWWKRDSRRGHFVLTSADDKTRWNVKRGSRKFLQSLGRCLDENRFSLRGANIAVADNIFPRIFNARECVRKYISVLLESVCDIMKLYNIIRFSNFIDYFWDKNLIY